MQSANPLKSALDIFGTGNADSLLSSATTILTNKFPQTMMNAYVTGLSGKWTVPSKMTINGVTFNAGE